MKKFLAIALVTAFVGATAFASSMSVPFFSDRFDGGSTAVTVGNIVLKNQTTETVLLAFIYTQSDGTDATPAAYTAPINPLAGVTFRPAQNKPGFEGVGNAFPDMVGSETGSLTVYWVGGAKDIIGRYAESINTQTSPRFGYLLPSNE